MNLFIDIGNSRTKWRIVARNGLLREGVLINAEMSEEDVAILVQSSGVNKIVLSNVGKSAISGMFMDVAEKYGKECIAIQSANEMAGLRFVYQEVASLGVDRCLAMIGAFENKGVLVIDAGSAITADFVNKDGMHLGGYILPGCRMLMLSLRAGTSNVLVDAELGSSAPGDSTKMCVNNGFTFLIQSLLNGLMIKARELAISDVMITGGDAEIFMHACSDKVFTIKSNLVLDGIEKLINHENKDT